MMNSESAERWKMVEFSGYFFAAKEPDFQEGTETTRDQDFKELAMSCEA